MVVTVKPVTSEFRNQSEFMVRQVKNRKVHLLPVNIESSTLSKLRVNIYLNQHRNSLVAAVNNSDSELNLKKKFYFTVYSHADICRYMYTSPLPPQKEKPHLQSSFFNTDNEDVVYE